MTEQGLPHFLDANLSPGEEVRIPNLQYWLARRVRDLPVLKQTEYAEYFLQAVSDGPDIRNPIPHSTFEFLCYLADYEDLVFHGTQRTGLNELHPIRDTTDLSEFGKQQMLFGSPDAIWSLWFAILDKVKARGTSNGCVAVEDRKGSRYQLYYFSIDYRATDTSPYVDGMIYVMRPDTFTERQHGVQFGSKVSVKPLLKLPVGPADFPYLKYVKGINFTMLTRKLKEVPNEPYWFNSREVFRVSPEIPVDLGGEQVDGLTVLRFSDA